MSFGRQRGGRWGMNFISASGPQSSISVHNNNNTNSSSNTGRSGRGTDRLSDFSISGYSSQAFGEDGSGGGARGGAAVPPPSSSSMARPGRGGYADPHRPPPPTLTPSSGGGRAFANLGRKRVADEDDYFLDDEDPGNLEYLPAPGSPAATGDKKLEAGSDSDGDSDDPLDKFMENIEDEVRSLDNPGLPKPEVKKPPKGTIGKSTNSSSRGVRDDIEQEDEIESYMRFMVENPHVGVQGDEDEDAAFEYDAEGNVIGVEKKMIDPLPPVDHSLINYAPFAKNFYVEHEDISRLDQDAVASLRQKLGVRVSGPTPLLRPVCSFGHLGFDDHLIEAIRRAGFTKPTPIQAQAVPLLMAGRDVIGIGKTGSGKTAAFLWPAIIHIMNQPPLKLGDGPIAVICSPTRELSQQIYQEAKKLARVYNLTAVCAYGGGSLWEQQKACEAGCELLICTPGRLIDLVKKKSTNLRRVTYLVFDEADKMFSLGFEPQVRSIANHVRPDRQTLLFSATFKRRLERLARDILTEPVRVVEGQLGEANEDITQVVEVFDKVDQKWDWLTRNIVRFTTEGSVLVFVTRKIHSEEVAQKLQRRDLKVLLIHGDMHQSERNSVIQSFKRQEAPILVATDVASRGLDIPSIHNVINYEVARDIDTHTHRIGRTGRAGIKGTAHTLFVAGKDPVDFAACLVQHLEAANQVIPERLRQLANSCSWFAHNRASLETLGQAHVFGSARPSSGFEPRPPKVRRGLGLSTTDDDETVRSGPAAAAAAGEGAELVRPGGLQADRFAAMKSAFSAQYNRRFVSAGVEATRYTHPETLKQTHDQKPAAEPLPIPTGDTDVHEEPPQQKQPSPQKFQLQWREVVPVETAVSHQPSHAEPTTESPIKKRRSRWD